MRTFDVGIDVTLREDGNLYVLPTLAVIADMEKSANSIEEQISTASEAEAETLKAQVLFLKGSAERGRRVRKAVDGNIHTLSFTLKRYSWNDKHSAQNANTTVTAMNPVTDREGMYRDLLASCIVGVSAIPAFTSEQLPMLPDGLAELLAGKPASGAIVGNMYPERMLKILVDELVAHTEPNEEMLTFLA
jgi:hypothetical protein